MNALAQISAALTNAPTTNAYAMNTASITLVEFPHAPSNVLITTHSPACQKVHYAMNLAGIAFTSDFQENPAAHKAENPAKQFPYLRVNGSPLADSTAILRWVCAQAEQAAAGTPSEETTPLYLADAAKRAEAWLWEEYADHVLYGYVLASRWGCDENFTRTQSVLFAEMPSLPRKIVPKILRRDILKRLVQQDVTRAGLDEAWRRMQEQLDALDARAPESGFWVSSTPSVADVSLAAMLNNLRNELTPKQKRWIEARPRLTAYLDRCAEAMHAGAAM